MPQEWGGAGLTILEQVVVQEELGKLTNALWDAVWRPANALRFCTPEQRARYLEPVIRGEIRDAYAVTEREAGSDPQSIVTTADKVDGGWLINGEKWFVTVGDHATFLIVLANAGADRRPTLFLVDKDSPGSRSRGCRGSCTPSSTSTRSSCSATCSSATTSSSARSARATTSRARLVHRGAADDRGAHHRRGGAGSRARARLGGVARAVRRADRELPDDPGDARRLRRRHRRQQGVLPPGRVGDRQRRRPQDGARQGVGGEARRVGGLGACDRPLRADLRRPRLRPVVPRRAPLPRAAGRPDLGGHLRDPAARHRQRARQARHRLPCSPSPPPDQSRPLNGSLGPEAVVSIPDGAVSSREAGCADPPVRRPDG